VETRAGVTIYTVGHSTRAFEEFVALLMEFEIETLVDVRTITASRYNPQYNKEELDGGLRGNGIFYIHIKELGGLRHTTKTSVNRAWKNLSFRGYADYMNTPEFTKGLHQLIKIANETRTCIMCAEAVPWRCHRSLISDALVIRDLSVDDIMTNAHGRPHQLTKFARVKDHTITYPAEEE